MPTKKKTEEITDSIMEAQNETEEQNTAPPAAEEQTEKPKQTRKKKTEITETEEQPVNETVEPQTEEKADEEAAAEPVKPKSRILTVEAKTGSNYTEQTRADIIWHEIQNAYITHRIMTGTLSGVECNDVGHHYAIADYNGFQNRNSAKGNVFRFSHKPARRRIQGGGYAVQQADELNARRGNRFRGKGHRFKSSQRCSLAARGDV